MCVASVAVHPRAQRVGDAPPRLSSAACSTRWRSTLRALLLMAFCPRLDLAPATAPALSPLPLFDRPTWPLLMDPLDVRGCGTGPAARFSVERRAYVEGAMRTNVVSCDSAAVTLLLGVLHVPQLYSLSRIHERGNAGGSAYAAGGTTRERDATRRRRLVASLVSVSGECIYDVTYPCFVAASTMAATVIPAAPDCARRT